MSETASIQPEKFVLHLSEKARDKEMTLRALEKFVEHYDHDDQVDRFGRRSVQNTFDDQEVETTALGLSTHDGESLSIIIKDYVTGFVEIEAQTKRYVSGQLQTRRLKLTGREDGTPSDYEFEYSEENVGDIGAKADRKLLGGFMTSLSLVAMKADAEAVNKNGQLAAVISLGSLRNRPGK